MGRQQPGRGEIEHGPPLAAPQGCLGERCGDEHVGTKGQPGGPPPRARSARSASRRGVESQNRSRNQREARSAARTPEGVERARRRMSATSWAACSTAIGPPDGARSSHRGSPSRPAQSAPPLARSARSSRIRSGDAEGSAAARPSCSARPPPAASETDAAHSGRAIQAGARETPSRAGRTSSSRRTFTRTRSSPPGSSTRTRPGEKRSSAATPPPASTTLTPRDQWGPPSSRAGAEISTSSGGRLRYGRSPREVLPLPDATRTVGSKAAFSKVSRPSGRQRTVKWRACAPGSPRQ